MTDHLWVTQPTGLPSPGDIAGYLLQAGWANKGANALWASYVKQFGAEEVEIEVPQRSTAPDYARAVRIMLEDLARLEERQMSALARDVRAASIDIIRIAISSLMTRAGMVTVEAGRRIYDAAREILLSAACAVINPKPVFTKRKPEETLDVLRRAWLGQTEVGSFVLTIECHVPPRLATIVPVEETDADLPFDRRVCLKLATALQGVEAASRESMASSSLEPFNQRVSDGVSANLCDAIADMIDATEAETLKASFSFASRRPVVGDVPKKIVIPSDRSPVLREAARVLKTSAKYLGMDVLGYVIKLDSMSPELGGTAVVHACIEGKQRNVRIELDQASYRTAIRAHEEIHPVRCTGNLEREGQSWVLNNPMGLTVAAAEEED